MRLTPTLAALAVCGLAANASAVSIKDDTVSLGVGVRLQTRVTIADATDVNGDEFGVQTAEEDTKNDVADFEIRRARLYLSGKYGENWKFQLALAADNIQADGTGRDDGETTRYAWVDYSDKFSEDLKWAIHFGLDKAFYNDAEYASSSSLLFPTRRATAEHTLSSRSTGVGFRLFHEYVNFGFDIQNNEITGSDASFDEDLFMSVRIEVGQLPAKRAESYVGKEGHEWAIGLDYGTTGDFDTTGGAGETINTVSSFGLDALLHWDFLTLTAEARWQTAEEDGEDDVDSEVFVVQAGWAFVLGSGQVIEPAVRITLTDLNTDVDEEVNYSGDEDPEVGDSGTSIELGVNVYFNGHGNKLQLALELWSAEEGDADATIVRLQHQLNF